MLLQPVSFPTSSCASYKHYCHLPPINPLYVRKEHWEERERDFFFTESYTQRHHVKRHWNTDGCFVLLPIISSYQTLPHEHSVLSFRIHDTVPPLSLKTLLCCVHTDTKHKCLTNMSLNAPLPTIFRTRSHSVVICQRTCTLNKHLPFFPFIA